MAIFVLCGKEIKPFHMSSRPPCLRPCWCLLKTSPVVVELFSFVNAFFLRNNTPNKHQIIHKRKTVITVIMHAM